MTNDKILMSIKKMLGINAEDDAFDTDIIIHINSALSRLSGLGVEQTSERLQVNEDETWLDLFGDNEKLNYIQEFVFLKVKLVFDPPSSASVIDSYKERIKELEWEINVEADKT